MNKVVLVEIAKNGSDLAVFLDGNYIISADPGAGDSVSMIEQMATGLASHYNIELIRHKYMPRKEDWSWGDVQKDLGTILRSSDCCEAPPLPIKISTGISAGDQLDSFQNATFTYCGDIAVSIRIEPTFPDLCNTQEETKKYLTRQLSPLCQYGWTVEVQIGPKDSE